MEIPVSSFGLSRDYVCDNVNWLEGHSKNNVTLLKYHHCIPIYEIYSPSYVTLLLELSKGMNIQCIFW